MFAHEKDISLAYRLTGCGMVNPINGNLKQELLWILQYDFFFIYILI
jgi:hypothetical protein